MRCWPSGSSTHLKRAAERELERVHGRVPGGGAVVIAMGKLGGREMTASSDLDLIVVYDFDPAATQSTARGRSRRRTITRD